MLTITNFPPQRIPDKEKTQEWAKDCVNYALRLRYWDNARIRVGMEQKRINYDLANGIMDEADVERVFNPMGIRDAVVPAKTQNYPIEIPKIQLLTGEELKRPFNYFVRAINDDAISEKEQEKNLRATEEIQKLIADPNINPDDIPKRIRDLSRYIHYDYQEKREVMATRLLKYYDKKFKTPIIFNQAFWDVLIASEEIYACDIVAGEPVLRKCDPLHIYAIRSGFSHRLEDSDIIVEDSYLPIGQVIDTYYEELTAEQIKDIEEIRKVTTSAFNVMFSSDMNANVYNPSAPGSQSTMPALITVDQGMVKTFGGSYDTEGNVRVTRVEWRSLRKIGKLKYYNEETGDEEETVVPENYKPNKAKGEEVKWLWIGEWWEGVRIAEDIYIRMRPKPLQFRDMNNLSSCRPGFVGTYYSINTNKALSLYDRIKPYKYLYNVFAKRTELAFAKFKGVIGELNLAAVPDGWDVDKWLYYAEHLGWAVYDPFTEAKKGVAQGKLAGNFNTFGGRTMNFDLGAYIQQHIQMLEYIEGKIGEITGVSAQRQGQIEQRETVRGIERSISQSSHVTEHWFSVHENTKVRVMEMLLETAKYCHKNKKKKYQYVDDGLSNIIFDIDGDLLNESSYGIFIGNSADDMKMMNLIQDAATQAVQSDRITFSQYIDAISSESIANIKRKLEESEQVQQERKMEEMRGAQEQAAQANEAMMQLEQQKLELERYKTDMDNATTIRVTEMNNLAKQMDQDVDNDGVPDIMEQAKLALDEQKAMQEAYIRNRELDLKEKEMKLKEKIESEKIKASKEIASKRATSKPKK